MMRAEMFAGVLWAASICWATEVPIYDFETPNVPYRGTVIHGTKPVIVVTAGHCYDSNHVAARSGIQVGTNRYPAKLIYWEHTTHSDLAFLEVDGPDVSAATLGRTKGRSEVVTIRNRSAHLTKFKTQQVERRTIKPRQIVGFESFDGGLARGWSGAGVYNQKGQYLGLVSGGPTNDRRIDFTPVETIIDRVSQHVPQFTQAAMAYHRQTPGHNPAECKT